MQTVIIAKNTLDPATWTKHETRDIVELLPRHFDKMPQHARIYHNAVAHSNDVTPNTEDDIERLRELDGTLYVMCYPGDPISIIIAVIAAVVVAAAVLLLLPRIPTLKNRNLESSNNSLTDRTNKPRPLQRIEDGYGTYRSIPTLLGEPYKVFKNNIECEISYMCIGRGSYAVSDIKDDTTPVDEIIGASVEIYGPNTSPLSGDSPQTSVGDPITDELANIKRSNSVNGQTMYAPNYKTIRNSLRFHFDRTITTTNISVDFTEYFEAGETLQIENATETQGAITVNLDGAYATLVSVSAATLTISIPPAWDAEWDKLGDFTSDRTSTLNAKVSVPSTDIVGPFYVDLPEDGSFLMNIYAGQGMFKDDGENQYSTSVTYRFTLTPVDENDNEIGADEIYNDTITGSSISRSARGKSFQITPATFGRYKIEAKRTSNLDKNFEGTVVDEIKWRDLYIVSPLSVTHFGDITTVFSVSFGVEGALALKERKLNMLVTRKVPERVSGTTFGALTASNSAADIICAMALDPYIGNRDVSELDVDNIYDTVAEVVDYFGFPEAGEFSYTFDNDNISFEEMVTAVANSVFCEVYRQGNKIKLFFEKETEDSVLLFNNRNKIPGEERRSVTFGRGAEYDGIQYQFIDPADDTVRTYHIPEDQSAIKPSKIESVGIRSFAQAYCHAWRAWNKIRYKHTSVEFEATQEADLLIRGNRIRVADGTRSGIQQGKVVSQNALELTLSDDVTFEGGVSYNIFLQLPDASVQSIAITAGSTSKKVILAGPTTIPLSLNSDNWAVATYQIVGNNAARETPFIVTRKDPPKRDYTVGLQAINYDARYYTNDTDFKLNALATDAEVLITTDDGDPIMLDENFIADDDNVAIQTDGGENIVPE